MSLSTAAPQDFTSMTSQTPFTASSGGGGEVGVVDYMLVVLLTVVSILVGTVKAVKKNKQNTASDYLLGGRSMSIVPVAFSLLGGFVSALSILGLATEVYFYGTQFLLVALGFLWGILLATKLVLPVLYPLQLVSVYEYLEMRFASPMLRRCTSLTQIFSMTFILGMCLYAPCLALSTVTGIPTWIAILFNGLLCTIYVTIGGVRAVVYTDVLQTLLMFLGPVIIVSKLIADFVGFDFWEISENGGRIEFFNMDPSPLVKHTFWNVQIFAIHATLSLIIFNQAQFQRIISVSSLQAASSVCYLFLIGMAVLWILFGFSGLVTYAIYADCDPLTAGRIKKKDEILPYVVLDKLGNGSGLVGLFIASVYGGVLSSVSSNANAVATLLWKDFLSDIPVFSKMTDTSSISTIKFLSALAGFLSIGMAMLVGRLGSILEVSISVTAALLSPIDGVFLTGITSPWVTTKGAVFGFFAALTFNMFYIVGKLIQGADEEELLPLSVEGCQGDIFPRNVYNEVHNDTFADAYYGAQNTSASTTVLTNLESINERSHWAVFDMSYCYLGPLAVLIVLVVATVVSCATGLTDPNLHDSRLVNAGCLRGYRSFLSFVGRFWTPYHRPMEIPGEMDVNEQSHLKEHCPPTSFQQLEDKDDHL